MEAEKIKPRDEKTEEKTVAQILKALKSIRYGHIQITVHDAKIVQIEKAEKIRL